MYPTSPQYRNSIINKIYPPSNGGYKFTAIYENDEPKYESGNNAIVFKVTDDKTEKTKAIKLFLIDNKERFFQYLEISKFLNKFNTQFFVSFNFIEKFIYVEVNQNPEENYFPGLIMEWAEGKTLGSKIQELCSTKNKSYLKKIAESFKDLTLFLLDNNIGHGDLKHDNIIVDEENNMKLIDYDGIYVPAFNNQISKELGTDSFQHPLRKSTDFNANIDHFSILTIYTSLIALSIDPDLFVKFNDQQNLIFTKEDFFNPDDSELFRTLSKIKEINKLVYCIKQSLKSDSIYIDNIKDILNGVFPKPKIVINHSPEILLEGNEVTINWTTENTESVKIDGKDYPTSGKITEKYYSSKKIIFQLENPFDKAKVEYELKVLNKPKINHFKTNNQKIEYNKSTFLNWNVSNASKVFLIYDGKKEQVESIINFEISPLKDTSYELKVIGLDNIETISEKINIQVFKRVEIIEFKSNLDFVVESIPIKLSWKIENDSKVTLSSSYDADIDVTGKNSIELKPKKDCSFILLAKNDLFQATQKIQISVQNLHKVPPLDLAMPKMPTLNISIPNLSHEVFDEQKNIFNNFLEKKEKFSISKTLKTLLSK
ncbi:protein kinase domain-containing protein [Flavobacterium aciduliphilum]|uniref:Protein kinase-like protein n=1 Tax=Flavobacterium aciduliphilum TaxID=1101402 RepID=A0A328YL94_9FLAO|nr:protein kinase family protein [Flavobacterium aciduliphilum]RAR73853.1 protein kinase-like protein [Flavobacterium aciduliphilum]